MFTTSLEIADESRIFTKYKMIEVGNVTQLLKWYLEISKKFKIKDFNIVSTEEVHLYFPDLDSDGDAMGMVYFYKSN